MADLGTTVGMANVRVVPNTKNFSAALKSFLERMERQNPLQVQMGLDQNAFAQRAKAAVEAAESVVRGLEVPIDMDGQAALGVKAKAAVEAAEAAVGSVEVPIDVKGGGRAALAVKAAKMAISGLGRSSMTATAGIGMFSGSLLKVTAVAGAATVAVSGLAAPIVAASSAALSAAVPIAGMVAAMAPAAIGAGVTAIVALKSAFSGMGAAITETDPEKFAEALAQLSPAAQSAVLAIRDMKEQWDAFAQGAQEAFWENFSNIGDLGVLLEPAAAAVQQVAGSFGAATSNLVAFISQGTGLSAMQDILAGGASVASSLGDALGSALQGVIAAGGAAAPILSDLAAKIAELAQGWGEKMVAAYEDGSLTAYFEGALEKVQEFGHFLGQLGGIVSGVFGAMNSAGAPFLGTIGQTVEALNEAVNSVSGQTALTQFFSAMSSAVGAVLPLVVKVAEILGTSVAPAIAQAVEVLAPFVSQLLDGLGPALDSLGAVLPEIAAALGPVLAALGEMAANVVPVLAPVLAELVRWFAAFAEKLVPLIPVIAGVAAVMFTIVNPIPVIIAAVAGLVGALITHWDDIKAGAASVWQAFKDMCSWIGDAAGSTASAVGKAFSDLGHGIVNAVDSAWEAAKTGFSNGVSAAVDTVSGFVQRVVELVTNLASTWWERNKEMWGNIISAFRDGVSAVVDWVASLPGAAMDALGNIGDLLFDSGRALIQGFIDGIKNMIGHVADAAASVVDAARDYFPFSPAKKGPFSGKGWVLYSGQSVGSAFAEGIADTTADAAAASDKLMAAASSNLGGFQADSASFGATAAAGGGGVDTSIHVGTIVAADPTAPMREVERMQKMASVRGGRF